MKYKALRAIQTAHDQYYAVAQGEGLGYVKFMSITAKDYSRLLCGKDATVTITPAEDMRIS